MRQLDEGELAVIAEVARMYYIEGMSQLEIANILFFSKAKVSRALRIAREEHIVEFQINYPLKRSIKLETELKRRFRLKEALVVTDLYENQNTDISIKRIGEMAANYLDETLKDGNCLGKDHVSDCASAKAILPQENPGAAAYGKFYGRLPDGY